MTIVLILLAGIAAVVAWRWRSPLLRATGWLVLAWHLHAIATGQLDPHVTATTLAGIGAWCAGHITYMHRHGRWRSHLLAKVARTI